MKQTFYILAAVMIGLAVSSCKEPAPVEKEAPPRSESAKQGPVSAEVTLSQGTVSLDQHLILTLKIVHPSSVSVELPALVDRVEGFIAGHSFERSSTDASGNTVVEKVVRLTPAVAENYRIAPIPIVYMAEGSRKWFPTPAMWIESATQTSTAKSFKEQVAPVWIRPSAKEVSLYAILALLLIGLIILAVHFIKKAFRFVRLLRMSPRERALEELRALLSKDLVSRNLVKEFYLELTMIVRLFIERGYHIRAPEQTTEEFLESAGKDSRFEPNVLGKLKSFLQSADLVKFAGFQPDQESTNDAIDRAKEFIKIESSSNPETGKKQEVDNA